MYIILDGMYVTMSISTGLYPNLDLWTANKLQLQLLELSVGNMTDICMVRNLFSSIVRRILSEKLKVKEAVESSAGGSKLERNQ